MTRETREMRKAREAREALEERKARKEQKARIARKTLAILLGALVLIAVLIGGVVLLLRSSPTPPPQITPVEGVVMLDGKPLQKVAIRFVPTGDYGPEIFAYAITDEKGRFTLLHENKQPGAYLGENQVVIQEMPPDPPLPRDAHGHSNSQSYYEGLGGRPIPPAYTSLGTTELKVTVTAEQREYTIVLHR